jgi:hypothetical protein
VTPFASQSEMYVRTDVMVDPAFAGPGLGNTGWEFFEIRHDTGNYTCYPQFVVNTTNVITLNAILYYADSGAKNGSKLSTFTMNKNQRYCFELYAKRASAPGANDGVVSFWINNVLYANVTGIDNDTVEISNFAIGNFQGNCVPQAGSKVYYDNIVCNNATSGRPGFYKGHLPAAGIQESLQDTKIIGHGILQGQGIEESFTDTKLYGWGMLTGQGTSESYADSFWKTYLENLYLKCQATKNIEFYNKAIKDKTLRNQITKSYDMRFNL